MTATPPLPGYTRHRDTSRGRDHTFPQASAASLAGPFDDRFPQPSTSFSLAHSRNASIPSPSTSRRSSTNSVTAKHTAEAATTGTGWEPEGGTIPRTRSTSAWRDYSQDVELLLGESGRGTSPSRTGRRAITPTRSNSHLGQPVNRGAADYQFAPTTPRNDSLDRVDDLDTTPKGHAERSTTSPSSSRPLHTPPQMFPSSPAYGRTTFDSPYVASRSRMSSQSSHSALRPPSAQSNSSNSSAYSLEDNSWATDLAPSHYYDNEVASPLFVETSVRSPSHRGNEQQARPLSEFDFAAAYARSDAGSSLPNSPMLPTVGIVQPASPVAPSLRDPPKEAGTEVNDMVPKEAGSTPAVASDKVLPPHTSPPLPGCANLLQAADATTPSTSRAPSPAPSLSPSAHNRPSSRTSSNRSVSSPVRPPRRVASSVNLGTKPTDSPLPAMSSTQLHSLDHAPNQSNLQGPHASSASSMRTNSTSTSPNLPPQSIFASPRGSPRPPSIPEKSRRRASTLGLGIKKGGSGHGRNESRDFDDANSRPGSVFDNVLGGGIGEGDISSFSNPDTPLSASDFADVYGKLNDDDGWDNHPATSTSVRSPSRASNSPSSTRTKPVSIHTRDAAFAISSDSATATELLETPEQADERAFNSKNHSREETIKVNKRGGENNVFQDVPSELRFPDDTALSNGSTSKDARSAQSANNGDSLAPTTERNQSSSRSSTPRGDAKARAAAFIADLKRSKQEAELSTHARQKGTQAAVDGDDTINISKHRQGSPKTERPEERDNTVTMPPSASVLSGPPEPDRRRQPKTISRTSDSSLDAQPKAQTPPVPQYQPSSRTSTLPATGQTQESTLPPLLRRRPLPMAIQASGEIQRARTAGERARIYAIKINQLNTEKSRLDEWIDANRPHRQAINKAVTTSTMASPLRTARSFRQDASSATFAPRGDGYRAKEIVSSTFGPRDLYPSNAPFPGVLSYTSNLTNTVSISSQRSLGSGLPAVSAQPGSGGKSSFFSRSLGRRASKREPPSPSSAHAHLHHGLSGGGGGVGGLPISNPSPSLYSSSATTATAGHNLRSISGPRMPGAGPRTGAVGSLPYPTLNSRASFDSRVSTPTNLGQQPHRASFSLASSANTPVLPSTTSTLPNSPNSFTSVSTSPSPLLPAASGGNLPSTSTSMSLPYVPASAHEEGIDSEALNRLIDVLPHASREELVGSLKKAGGGDDILAISIYLSERS